MPYQHRVTGHSVLSSWIRSICQTARGYHTDPLPLMKAAGLDPDLLHIPETRYELKAVRRFWHLLIQATGDPLIGLKVGQEIQAASLNGLGLAMMSSASLDDLLKLFARYGKIISTTMHLRLQHDSTDRQCTVMALHTADGSEPMSSARLACIAFLYRQACALAQHDITPRYVTLTLDDPSLSTRLDAYFHTPVTLGAEQDAIAFDYNDTIEPYAGANPQLRQTNENIIRQHLAELERTNFSERVLRHIQNALSQGEPKLADIAACLNITPRTLQRRLREEQHSFQSLLDAERKHMAHDLLAHSDRRIVEISYLLGFSDPSNLCRASRRWFGCSPAAHRRHCLNIIT